MLNNPFFNLIPAIEKGVIGNGYDWGQASIVTVCGLVIVFAMLLLLVIVISIFGGIMDKANGVQKVKPAKKETPVSAPAPTPAPVVTIEEDNDEIIAVIAAAVDAIYADSGVKPVIRRIKPAATNRTRSAWASAGVYQNTRAF